MRHPAYPRNVYRACFRPNLYVRIWVRPENAPNDRDHASTWPTADAANADPTVRHLREYWNREVSIVLGPES
jgi:hypothetical protein